MNISANTAQTPFEPMKEVTWSVTAPVIEAMSTASQSRWS